MKEKYENKLTYIDVKNFIDIQKQFEHNIKLNQIDTYTHEKKTILDFDNDFKNYSINLDDFHTRTFIEISIGCEFNCTYCNIKKIKGNTKSLDMNIILEKIKNELKKGIKEFHLLSDDCGSYGIDIGTTFPDLLDNILLLNSDIKIHIGNINPFYLLKYYEKIKDYIYTNKIVYILLPLQHSSIRILNHMKRAYNITNLMIILTDIKKNSEVELCNEIIFNFHDESLEEFVDTFKLLKFYNKTFYHKYSDINNLYGGKVTTYLLKEKIILLKKLQNKYSIDITL